ncbi:hypothetical protein ABW20_dc0109817 [Dactylellina cionopaga]|nr:hypothetical protein ABW20_dc0109817 [Dactylellina cionopaga]
MPASNDTSYRSTKVTPLYTPKLIIPIPTPHSTPQTSIQPAIATPVLVIPKDENPFDLAPALEGGRMRRVSTGSIDPFAEEDEDDEEDSATFTNYTAKNLLGVTNYKRAAGNAHVGWKSDFLTVTPEEGNDEGAPAGYSNRRSSSLPDLPAAAGGRQFKSVKGRRATPWVHNVGIYGNTVRNGNGIPGKKVKLAFPSLKRLSDASAKSVESGYEIWFDALEEQEQGRRRSSVD